MEQKVDDMVNAKMCEREMDIRASVAEELRGDFEAWFTQMQQRFESQMQEMLSSQNITNQLSDDDDQGSTWCRWFWWWWM